MTDTNTATQISDQFKSMVSGDVTCKSSGELMTNYIAGTSIDARHAVEAVQDQNGDPILFSISSPDADGANQLYVTMRDEDEQTGWKQFNISPVADKSVQVCGVSQEPKTGKYILAVAVDADGNGESEVYITNAISQDTSKIDWSDFSSQWVDRPGTPAGTTVTRLLIGENPYGAKIPIIVATTQEGNNAKHYFIQGDTTKSNFTHGDKSTDAAWMDYTLPVHADEILDIAIGMAFFPGDAGYMLGTYALYTNQNDLGLKFTSVYDNTGITHTFDLEVPDGTKVIQSIPDINNSNITTLFASGNGLYVYESTPQVSASSSTVTPKPDVPYTQISDDSILSSVKELIARQDSDNISIWARNSNQDLYYVRGSQDAEKREWTEPLLMRKNVARIAAIRNQAKKSNAVIYVESDNTTISYLWQDPETTLWKETDMPLPTNETVQEFSCYTTTLSFTDANDNPVIQQEVGINASEWTYATVNGYYKSLDNDTSNPIIVRTDSQGKVTIINKVKTVSTPTFWANTNFLEDQHIAHPASNILASLSDIETGQDLLDATTQDGENVIDDDDLRKDTDTLDSVANGIQQILGAAQQLPADGTPFTGTPTSDGQVWGMSFSDGTAKYQTGDDANQLQQQLQGNDDSFQVGDNIKKGVAWVGDALESMWNDIEGVAHFIVDTTKKVVDGVANIIVQIGEQIVSFVVSTISDVLSFVGWLFKTIKVGLEKLKKWLGFLFEWDDILKTHDVFTNMSNQTMDYIVVILKNAKTPITNFFDKLIDDVNNMPALKVPSGLDANENILSVSKDSRKDLDQQTQDTLSSMQTNTGMNFTSYQAEHGGVSAPVTLPDSQDLDDLDSDGQVKQVFDDLKQILDDFLNTFESTFEDIKNLYETNELTIGNLLKVFTKDFLVGVLEVIRDVFLLIIDIADLVIDIIKKLLNKTIEIPFISGLYSKISGGNNFTMLDALSLFVSIPATIGYKIVKGNAPFADGSFGLDSATYDQIYPLPLFSDMAENENESVDSFIPNSFTGEITPNAITDSLVTISPDSENIDPTTDENTDLPQDDTQISDGLKVYTQVGGFAFFVSQVVGSISSTVETLDVNERLADTESRAGDIASDLVDGLQLLDIGVSIISVATSFPLKEGNTNADKWERGLDVPLWIGDIVGVLVKGALLAEDWRKIPEPEEVKDIEKSLLEVSSLSYDFIFGVGTVALNLISGLIELDETVHGTDEDEGVQWENAFKLLQNIVGGVGEGGLAGGSLIYYGGRKIKDPDTITLGGVVMGIGLLVIWGGTLMGTARLIYIIYEDKPFNIR